LTIRPFYISVVKGIEALHEVHYRKQKVDVSVGPNVATGAFNHQIKKFALGCSHKQNPESFSCHTVAFENAILRSFDHMQQKEERNKKIQTQYTALIF